MPSSGVHSNGYSLIRKVLATRGLTPNPDLLDELTWISKSAWNFLLVLILQMDVQQSMRC